MDVESYVHDNILITGEEIIWRGRPNPARQIGRSIMGTLFGLFFLGFAIFWTFMAAQDGGFFALFGIPFIAIGGWLVTTPLRERRRAHSTYYAVTNERALIIEIGRQVRTTSIAPDDITDLERIDREDGSGDLQFRLTEHRGRNGTNRSADFTDGFWGTNDVKGAAQAVNTLIRDTREHIESVH